MLINEEDHKNSRKEILDGQDKVKAKVNVQDKKSWTLDHIKS